jgi:hypothetical protein
MIHEHTTKTSDTQRHLMPLSMIARKASGSESSGADALRQSTKIIGVLPGDVPAAKITEGFQGLGPISKR